MGNFLPKIQIDSDFLDFSIFDKSIDITVEYENLNCDSNKKIFTQFEDKDQINIYNCNVTIYN